MRRPTVIGWAAQLGCGSMVKELGEGRAKLALEDPREKVFFMASVAHDLQPVGFVSFELYHPLICYI